MPDPIRVTDTMGVTVVHALPKEALIIAILLLKEELESPKHGPWSKRELKGALIPLIDEFNKQVPDRAKQKYPE